MKTFEELKTSHPCFAVGAKTNKGRVHLPVSPGCNISCNFCKINYNDTENRPAVANQIITPLEALEVVRKAVELCPDITVVGVAGPGDTLNTPYALETFRLIKQNFPNIIKCMSTNGLNLLKFADEIIDIGVDSLTVTVNAINPDILSQIVSGVDPELLIYNQLSGIEKIAKAGVTIKVNTVLIPEINAEHIVDVAKTVAEKGAKICNIIPIIPQHKLSFCSVPSCELINDIRLKCEKYINVFRHCQRCRADAIGIPGGKDFGKQIYLKELKIQDTFSHG